MMAFKTVIVSTIEEVEEIERRNPSCVNFRPVLNDDFNVVYLVEYECEFYTKFGGVVK